MPPENRVLIRRSGTIALSSGRYGGFYLHRHRVCLGRVALTYCPAVEIDDLMEGYAAYYEQKKRTPACRCGRDYAGCATCYPPEFA